MPPLNPLRNLAARKEEETMLKVRCFYNEPNGKP